MPVRNLVAKHHAAFDAWGDVMRRHALVLRAGKPHIHMWAGEYMASACNGNYYWFVRGVDIHHLYESHKTWWKRHSLHAS